MKYKYRRERRNSVAILEISNILGTIKTSEAYRDFQEF